MSKKTKYIPYQLCPKCNGDGNLWRFNSPSVTDGSNMVCDVCNETKIIPMYEIKEQTHERERKNDDDDLS